MGESRAIYNKGDWEEITQCDNCPCYDSKFGYCNSGKFMFETNESVAEISAFCKLPLYSKVAPRTPDEIPKPTESDPGLERYFLLHFSWTKNGFGDTIYRIAYWNGECWDWSPPLPGDGWHGWEIVSWQELPSEWNKS